MLAIFIALIPFIVVLIQSKIVYKKLEHKPVNFDLYQRDLPSNLRPAQVRLLLNDGLIDETSLAATIVDLIDRGYLNIAKEGIEIKDRTDIFRNEEIIISRTEKSTDDLLRYEKFVIDWFINKYGNGKEVTSGVVREKLHKFYYYEQPCDLFECWQGLVLLSFPLKKYYRKTKAGNFRLLYALFLFLGLLPIIPIIGEILGIYGLGCLFFASPCFVLNDEGIEEKDKWLDLKRYLEDFSNMKQYTTEMVSVWEFYLTYSIALGIKSISSKEIESFFGDNIYNYFLSNMTRNTSEEQEYPIIQEVSGNYEETLTKEINEELQKLDLR